MNRGLTAMGITIVIKEIRKEVNQSNFNISFSTYQHFGYLLLGTDFVT